MERLLRVKEVASITGEDVMTIYRRIRTGEIAANPHRSTRSKNCRIRITQMD